PETVLLISVSVSKFSMPPPATARLANAVFPETIQSVNVSVPSLVIKLPSVVMLLLKARPTMETETPWFTLIRYGRDPLLIVRTFAPGPRRVRLLEKVRLALVRRII